MLKYIFAIIFPLSVFFAASAYADHDVYSDLRVRAYKNGFVLEDQNGKKLNEKRYDVKPFAVFIRNKYIYCFWHSGRIEVMRIVSGDRLLLTEHKNLGEKIVKVSMQDGNFLIVTEENPISTYMIKKGKLKLWKRGVENLKVSAFKDPKMRIKGKVIKINRGKIIFNKGFEDGLEEGDYVEIRSMKSRFHYDALSDKTVNIPSKKIVAVVKINKVYPHKSTAEISLGSDVNRGDIFAYRPKYADFILPKFRKWDMKRTSIKLYPGFLLGGLSVAGEVQADYHKNMVHVSLNAFGYAGEASDDDFKELFFSSILGMRAGVEGNSFELGLGIKYATTRVDGQNIAGTYMESYARLGLLDGGHIEMGVKTGNKDFNGIWLVLQKDYNDRNTFSLMFDMTQIEHNFVKTEDGIDYDKDTSFMILRLLLQDKIRLYGSGGPGSMYVPVFFGMNLFNADISYRNDGKNYDSVSFVIGAGLEYRF